MNNNTKEGYEPKMNTFNIDKINNTKTTNTFRTRSGHF